MEMDDVEMMVRMTGLQITMNEEALSDLQMETASQTITSDETFVNNADIVVMALDTELGTFDLCPGETLEFHLALSDVAGLDTSMAVELGDNEVLKLYLTENGNTVAESDVRFEDPDIMTDEPVNGN
jgi:hypothetical protein